ncbi:transcription factor subunit Med10 of mediator complex [Chloropicon primus]|uniref:Mediator of RNA polymerase II transcription subunit 10 n=1 Tax=Chloropicon primus TaxID=1764295 RepID=A0A5B8MGY3_9CHLO|nr:transcription factor subunit Med10 of mediator complex [Chloropicon primus]UPQ98895.1 transcription factor subunit Med10 of mediator complex [Chloropicon primus]|mmetsp:Transcript_4374/g.12873  ORF Transcript_4374/g.12873 Transcript_4374/m.12873 type:complete len:132 (-) Transcript_4374:788-1183(-)|eukprot:QDZ19683.1 transcription factor subunit Med10 of mediator complex [Chloropicon primus]
MEAGDPEGAVRGALTKIHSVERLVKDFSPGSSEELVQRLNDFVASLGKVREATGKTEVEFPVELIKRLDTGVNPDKFVIDALHTCVVENQKVKGKATNLQKFHDALVEQATAAFPVEAEAYRKLKSNPGSG